MDHHETHHEIRHQFDHETGQHLPKTGGRHATPIPIPRVTVNCVLILTLIAV
ncbi:hypothetical protein [Streptomyces sp. NBC_00459]|uniref:hypothetical protein n=1 Tax=Streptomyces sp. NBC_00459 TaxID=2975749 RepID=UPI002E18D61B